MPSATIRVIFIEEMTTAGITMAHEVIGACIGALTIPGYRPGATTRGIVGSGMILGTEIAGSAPMYIAGNPSRSLW
ncbi:MAG: hypothetical protein SwBeaMacB_08760 [Shewanella algae]